MKRGGGGGGGGAFGGPHPEGLLKKHAAGSDKRRAADFCKEGIKKTRIIRKRRQSPD